MQLKLLSEISLENGKTQQIFTYFEKSFQQSEPAIITLLILTSQLQ
tara:strand:+ start:553 stop:690 length:138 start_codon:yes stop_codon:yes gene_type:complete